MTYTINDATMELWDDAGNRGIFQDGEPVYAAYLEWVKADPANIPAHVFEPKPVVPQEVSMRQARQALLRAGMLDTVEQVVAQADRAVQIDWHKGQTVRRDWPALKVVQTLLHMTDRQIDELFILAGTL